MKVVSMIARILLGALFLFSGITKFHDFFHQPPPPGVAGQFMMLMLSTKYIMLVGLFEGVGGILLLFNRYVPLALALLAPVIVNILAVNALMVPSALPLAFLVVVLWILVYIPVRSAFQGLYQAKVNS
jgi:putative oxidoreductase